MRRERKVNVKRRIVKWEYGRMKERKEVLWFGCLELRVISLRSLDVRYIE